MKRVYIEITNQCNLQCSFCHLSARAKTRMDIPFFTQVIRQVKPYTEYIYLHVQGEPRSHPQFEEILDVCAKYGMKVQLVTNGTLLYRYPHLYKHPALRKVSFSVQSIEFSTVDINAYMNEIEQFCVHASELSRPYCEIRFWRDDQMKDTRTVQCLKYLTDRYTLTENFRSANYMILPGVYIDLHNSFTWPADGSMQESSCGTCRGAIDQIAVLSDGTVVPCCLDADGEIPLGSLADTPLSEILQSRRYLQMKEGFRRGILTETLCRKCTYRNRFTK